MESIGYPLSLQMKAAAQRPVESLSLVTRPDYHMAVFSSPFSSRHLYPYTSHVLASAIRAPRRLSCSWYEYLYKEVIPLTVFKDAIRTS